MEEIVTSPSYTIISQYLGRIPLYHVDLYRIGSEEEIEELGLREILDGPGVSVVEWGSRMEEEPEGAIHIQIEITGDQERVFHIRGTDL